MKEKGTITVFLSFSFLIIMALILVLLEGARVRAAASVADMQLTTCVESLLGEFYRPLYEKYGVFGIDTSFGGRVPDIEELTDVLTGFAGESSFGLRLEEGEISATRPFVTADGGRFLEQVAEYEKYCAAIDTIGSLLERIGILSKENEVYKIYERQMEIEDSLARIDQNTLLLMEKIDGPVCSGYSVGEIHEMFVKSFMTRGVDPVSVGINNLELWMLLEDKYFDPNAYVENAAQYFSLALPKIEERDALKERLEILLTDRKSLNDEIADKAVKLETMLRDSEESDKGKKGKKEKSKESKEITYLRNELEELHKIGNELEKTIEEVSEETDDLNESINDLVLSAAVQTDELMRRVSGCLFTAREAVELIEEDRGIAEKTKPLISLFDSLVETSKDILTEESYNTFRTSLARMRRYTGLDGRLPDYEIIEDSLGNDVSVLACIERDANIGTDISKAVLSEVSSEMVGSWSKHLDCVRESIAGFSYDKLVFDYSEMRPDRILCELSNDLKRTVGKGFLGLIMDSDRISEKKLTVRIRPSDMLNPKGHDLTDAGKMLSEVLGKESGAESFYRSDVSGVMSGVGGKLNKTEPGFMEKMMLILYIREHFGDNIDRSTSSQSALVYEQEYILSGNGSDIENLTETVSKIMMVRMVTSGAYVLTNPTLHSRAAEIASSLVGFTGLYFLTSIVKYMIMFVWSAEQALVETAAIVAGKKIPILTTSSSYCIDSFDPAAITPDGIRNKVKSFKESELSLLYGDYLLMFMIMLPCEELSLRSMDMIEENIRWAYDDNFLLENCITGFDTKLTFSCPSRYVGIFDGLYSDVKVPDGYGFVRGDSVDY